MELMCQGFRGWERLGGGGGELEAGTRDVDLVAAPSLFCSLFFLDAGRRGCCPRLSLCLQVFAFRAVGAARLGRELVSHLARPCRSSKRGSR